MEFKKSKSTVKPVEIDKTSSPAGVYIRINIVETEPEDENSSAYFEYDEAYLTNEEFNQYVLIKNIQGKEVNAAQIEYDYKMDTPVEYPENGFTYKPRWAEEIYVSKITLGTALPSLFPLSIYDSTDLETRKQDMTVAELTQLSLYLGSMQEQYFNEYKQHKAFLNA